MTQMKLTGATVEEALSQVPALESLQPRQISKLRLLTEGMFSMAEELLHKKQLDFAIDSEPEHIALKVAAAAPIDNDAREQFLSMSTSGKNEAAKGFRGFFRMIVDTLTYGQDLPPEQRCFLYGFLPGTEPSVSVWTLSAYMAQAPKETVKHEWDGMEKSIIANFADAIAIGVRNGRMEMTVTMNL